MITSSCHFYLNFAFQNTHVCVVFVIVNLASIYLIHILIAIVLFLQVPECVVHKPNMGFGDSDAGAFRCFHFLLGLFYLKLCSL